MKKMIFGVLLGLCATSASAYTVTATFTGIQKMVQTVSYQMAWRCEYQYNGAKYYFVFDNQCPHTVQLR